MTSDSDSGRVVQLEKRFPAPAELAGAVKRMQRDSRFIADRFDELLERHKDRWVAAHDEEIVGYGKDLRELLRRLEARGLPLAEVTVKFITERPSSLLL